jgi:hypothetical protein
MITSTADSLNILFAAVAKRFSENVLNDLNFLNGLNHAFH